MKKIISILLIITTICSLCVSITGCKKETTTTTPNTQTEMPSDSPTGNISDTKQDEIKVTNEIFSEFNVSLMNFLNENIKEGDNYMASPLSLRYALALATIGANNDTQKGLLEATKFKSIEEYIAWCESVNKIVEDFDKKLELDKKIFEENYGKYVTDANTPDRKLIVANSIWHNESYGLLEKAYINNVKEHFNSEVQNLPISEFKTKINNWVNEKTNGLISELFSQELPSDLNTMLINTLYLKSAWVSSFEEYNTKEADFTTYKNEKVKKDFMYQQNDFEYYEDKDLQVVIIPLYGDINVAFAIGDTKNIATAITEAKEELVSVTIPKFEIETTIEGDTILKYLRQNGATLALSDDADFSSMIKDYKIKISKIIQKTKIKVDEEGLEAAAVTAISMDNATALPMDPPKPKEFKADKPFTFYIYSDNNLQSELLFYGAVNQ